MYLTTDINGAKRYNIYEGTGQLLQVDDDLHGRSQIFSRARQVRFSDKMLGK